MSDKIKIRLYFDYKNERLSVAILFNINELKFRYSFRIIRFFQRFSVTLRSLF